ncbi:uncharacterized protein PFL1_04757 [Pseudozyma flocculosa PF-1]|uniref:Pentacotripeptide-repeat region of PRORP domain-containing protein n=2 Tax=Pseudozyma flocculosa TaxID=84751 RepID=A0A5C3F7K0_9BASI|nr:uncharacterized protein PFL1_04757 [Pseudozyma flocculosa PF-1]EPQ27619.1 hypothetical protein PFL1_04757 [Pseudozyma flocculosa PF-1]SPO39251.1 uncharacterized protein PSFLO_04731 [Pseudozyma flocculosa]
MLLTTGKRAATASSTQATSAAGLDSLALALAPWLSTSLSRPLATQQRSAHHDASASASASNRDNDRRKRHADRYAPGSSAGPQHQKQQQPRREQQQPRRRPQRTPNRALFRLDPVKPLLQHSSLDGFNQGTSTSYDRRDAADAVASRSRAITQLHTALEYGDAGAVFQAYIRVPKDRSVPDHGRGGLEAGSIRSSLTVAETQMVLRRLVSDTPRLQEGLLRLVTVVEEIRRRRRLALLLSQRAEQEGRRDELVRCATEAQEWDRLLDASTMNAMISYTGRCVRAAGPEEVDEALTLLLDAGADVANTSMAPTQHGSAQDLRQRRDAGTDRLRQAVIGPRLRSFLERQRTMQRQPSPDRTTYNTILDIVSRSVHRHRAKNQGEADQGYDRADEDDRATSLEGAAAEQDGSASQLASNMQRLGVDADRGDYTVETAVKIFHALLDRMRHVSRLSPDRVTYNIILNMHSRLGRWDAVAETVQSMLDDDLLEVADVNAVVWRWAISARGPAQRGDRAKAAGRVYHAMRGNLLEFERRRSRLQAGHSEEVGTAAATSSRAEGKGEDTDLPPLQVSYRDGSAPKPAARWSTAPDEPIDALARILSLERLPEHIVPSSITYAILIKLQTFAGDFGAALSTFRDMISTPEVEVRRDADGRVRIHDAPGPDRYHRATPDIFSSFFRGYAKHGRPMRLVYLDEQDPLRSEWEPYEDDASSLQSGWNVKTFGEIFEAFLRIKPLPQRSQEPGFSFSVRPVKIERQGAERGSRASELLEASTLPDGTLGDSTEAAALRSTAESILGSGESAMLPTSLTQAPLSSSGQVEAAGRAVRGQDWVKARRAPTTHELFFLLTAIRRVSGDDAAWSLAMWQKVEDKFGPAPRDQATAEEVEQRQRQRQQHDDGVLRDGDFERRGHDDDHAADSATYDNREGWTGFKKDSRLRWILQYLGERGRGASHEAAKW